MSSHWFEGSLVLKNGKGQSGEPRAPEGMELERFLA
jgi:hypothetical protein